MVVCICNNISDKTVTEAIAAGAKDIKSILRHVGLKVQCATCISTVRDILRSQSIDGDVAAL